MFLSSPLQAHETVNIPLPNIHPLPFGPWGCNLIEGGGACGHQEDLEGKGAENMEHSDWIPPKRSRKRAEWLSHFTLFLLQKMRQGTLESAMRSRPWPPADAYEAISNATRLKSKAPQDGIISHRIPRQKTLAEYWG